jgi:hypothetical protein
LLKAPKVPAWPEPSRDSVPLIPQHQAIPPEAMSQACSLPW